MQQRKRKPNVFLIILGVLAYAAITAAFGWQTYEFVSWLMPSDDWLMKSVAMFSFDGCATGYALFDMFYHFRLRKSKQAVINMWIFTLGMSTFASVLQMYLASTHLVPHTVDPVLIYLSYAIVIVVFLADMIAIYRVFRAEYVAWHPEPAVYDDDEEYIEQPVSYAANAPSQSTIESPKRNDGLLGWGKRIWKGEQTEPQQTSTPVQQQLSASSTPSHDAIEAEQYKAFLAWQKTEHAPFPEALLNHQQADQVSQNGHKQ